MDETLARELAQDLRETQARLDAALETTASLKVLLALRTHQHDQAWQAEQRLGAELAAERARTQTLAADLAQARDGTVAAADLARAEAQAHALSEALAEAQERLAAAGIVLGAVVDSLGWRGLDRRRFRVLIAQASAETPESGPAAARHAVLLTEARRVLGVRA